MNDIKRTKIQEIVTPCNEITDRLSKEFVRLNKIAMEDREEAIELIEKEGVLDDVLHFLKGEGDKGDLPFLNLYNFWKDGQLPE